MAPDTTVLGFDFGERQIGVAVGQTVTHTASPLRTIHVRNHRPDWDAIARLVREYQPQLLVLGMPQHADGTEHRLTLHINGFRRQLERRYRLPVQVIDESLSSHEALERLGGAGDSVDAVAAQVILETWLNEQGAQQRP